MNSTNTGGPAFPEVRIISGDNYNAPTKVYYGGMTLRDYFAAKAMQGFLMDDALHKEASAAPEWLKSIADASYELADAMLKAREA